MVSNRQRRLQIELQRYLSEAYENYCEGVRLKLGQDPRSLAQAIPLRTAFSDVCAVVDWARVIQRTGQARFLLVEIRSALPLAMALAALGIYEAAALQLRYVLECFFAFLYFRDHPRELEFAQRGEDQWELTRPSVVVKYLKKLPEYDHAIGCDLLNELWVLYSDLSAFAHPRTKVAMGLRKFLTDAAPNAERAKHFAKSVRSLACSVSGLVRLSDHAVYARSAELWRECVRRPVKAAYYKRIEKQVAAVTAGT